MHRLRQMKDRRISIRDFAQKRKTGTILKKTAYQKCTSIQCTMSSLMSRLFKPKIYPLMMIQFIIFFNPFFYRPTVYAMKVQKCGAFTWHWLTKEPRRKMDNLLHNDEVISITVFSFIFFQIRKKPENTRKTKQNSQELHCIFKQLIIAQQSAFLARVLWIFNNGNMTITNLLKFV